MLAFKEVSVTNTATLLTKGGSNSDEKTLFIRDVSATIYIGGEGVTVANGYPIKASEIFMLDLNQGDDVYLITATTATCRVLISRSEPFS